MKKTLRVALLHDWLTGMRGGEKCLEKFLSLYPDADVYSLIHVPGSTRIEIDRAVKGTSWLQRLPDVHRYYRVLLPLFPQATARMTLEGYDLVISTSHAAVKNIRIPPGTFHVCYCFTPMRYVWDQAEQYLGRMRYPASPLISYLRAWDRAGSDGVDEFIGISRLVQARIRRFYGRRSAVIYPPVDAGWITPRKPGEKGEGFLYAGALVPYKRVDLIVEAFNRLKLPLWIVGDGPERRKLEALAGQHIHFFGSVTDSEMAQFFRRCRALIFPGKEDFGMVPVEVMAAGRPVIALAAGGARETVRGISIRNNSPIAEGQFTGVFIDKAHEGSATAIRDAVEFFMAHEKEFTAEACIRQAELFSAAEFDRRWQRFIEPFGFPATTKPATSMDDIVNA